MKISVAVQIIEILNNEDLVTAEAIAGECGISVRSVHRYLDELTVCGIPVNMKRGKYGGVWLDEEYKKRNYNVLVPSKDF